MLKIVNTLLVFTLLFITACGPDYNTNFDPPPPDARLDDVFPNEIDGMTARIDKMDLTSPIEGFAANYGQGKIVIQAILAPNNSVSEDYFKDVFVPRFDEMKNHFRGKINGRWSASGTDENDRKYFAWVNKKWIFAIGADNKNFLSAAIDAFKYVSK